MAGNKLVTKQMKNCLLRASLKAKIEIILVLIIILNCYFVFPFFQIALFIIELTTSIIVVLYLSANKLIF